MLGKNLRKQHFEIFFSYFCQKIGFDICMKCHSLFAEENKKNIVSVPSAE